MDPVHFSRQTSKRGIRSKKSQAIPSALEAIRGQNNSSVNSLPEIKQIPAEKAQKVPSPYQKPDNHGVAKNAIEDAMKYGWLTAARIQKYGPLSQNDLVAIAKICAAEDGGGTSANIDKFNIQSEKDRIAIAEIAAAHGGIGDADQCGGISAYIQNYEIENQEALVRIAKIAAKQSGFETAKHFSYYEIADEEARLEILKEALKQNPNAIRFADNFEINQEQLLDLKADIVRQHPLLASLILELIPSHDTESIFRIQAALFSSSPRLAKQLSRETLPLTRKKLDSFRYNDALLIADQKLLSKKEMINLFKALEQIDKEKNPNEKKTWLITALTVLKKSDPLLLKYILKKDILKKILTIRPRSMRYSILHDITAFNQKDKLWMQKYRELNKLSGKGKHRLVPNLYLARLINQGMEEDAAKNLSKLINNASILRKPRVQKIFYPLLVKLLEDNRAFNIVDIQSLLICLFSDPERLFINLNVIETLVSHGEGKLLTSQLLDVEGDFSRLFNLFFQINSPLENYDNFANRYNDVFGFRNKSGDIFLSLWKSMRELPRERKQKSFKEFSNFMKAVLDGNLQKYRLENSPYLSDLKVNLDEWQDNLTGKMDDGWSVHDTDKPKLILESFALLKNQRNPDIDTALLSILADAKNRVIIVKNEQNKVRGFAVLKLLIDKTSKEPVLFLDKIHVKKADVKTTSDTILKAAKKKSEIMELPLYSLEAGSEEERPIQILSPGTKSQYEYCETAGGAIPYGIYSIKNARLIKRSNAGPKL